MTPLPPPIPVMIRASSIPDGWSKAVHFVMAHGTQSEPDYKTTPTLRCNMKLVIENPMQYFYGDDGLVCANSVLHPAFRTAKILTLGIDAFYEYLKIMDGSYAKKYDNMDADTRSPYSYVHRLKMYPTRDRAIHIDQLAYISSIIGDRVGSRRLKANLWIPSDDLETFENQPCFQEVKFENLGEGQCHIEIFFRSWDLWGGLPFNIPAICDLLYKEVLEPNDLEMTRLTCNGSDTHIYNTDWEDAKKINIPVRASDDILYF